MKKVFTLLLVFFFVFTFSFVYAADELSFDLTYTGDIIKNEEKDAKVVLKGVNAPTYAKVRIKVDISGPATPSFIAYDSTGTKYDIAQTGYWGPETGFAVAGDFENATPIKATFPEAGTYTITLSLIDIQNSNSVITSKVITLDVEDNIVDNDDKEDDVTEDEKKEEENQVTEIPTTGTTMGEYAAMCALVFSVCYIGYYVLYRKKATN